MRANAAVVRPISSLPRLTTFCSTSPAAMPSAACSIVSTERRSPRASTTASAAAASSRSSASARLTTSPRWAEALSGPPGWRRRADSPSSTRFIRLIFSVIAANHSPGSAPPRSGAQPVDGLGAERRGLLDVPGR